MRVLLSPAKTFRKEAPAPAAGASQPQFLEEATRSQKSASGAMGKGQRSKGAREAGTAAHRVVIHVHLVGMLRVDAGLTERKQVWVDKPNPNYLEQKEPDVRFFNGHLHRSFSVGDLVIRLWPGPVPYGGDSQFSMIEVDHGLGAEGLESCDVEFSTFLTDL